MISRTHRFHGQKSLLNVYRRGDTVRQSLCTLKFIKNPHQADYRLAVVISKKISKSAVVRNRIRRRIFEAVRRNEHLITGAPDMVITVFSDQMRAMPATDIEKLVINLLKKLTDSQG